MKVTYVQTHENGNIEMLLSNDVLINYRIFLTLTGNIFTKDGMSFSVKDDERAAIRNCRDVVVGNMEQWEVDINNGPGKYCYVKDDLNTPWADCDVVKIITINKKTLSYPYVSYDGNYFKYAIPAIPDER